MSAEQPEDPINSDLEELERDMRRVREKRRKVQELEEELDREIEDLQDLRQKRRRDAYKVPPPPPEDEYEDEDDEDDEEKDVDSGVQIRIEQAAEGLEGLGDTIEAYVSSIMDSVAESMEGALDGLFAHGPRTEAKVERTRRKADHKRRRKAEQLRRKLSKKKYRFTDQDLAAFPEESAQILGILADANRLKILQELENGRNYQKDLSERTNIKGGQWKHHTDKLMQVGFMDQEAARGRYLITRLGLEALKLAEMLYFRKKSIEQELELASSESEESDNFDVPIE